MTAGLGGGGAVSGRYAFRKLWTHCKRGHALTPENVLWKRNGKRRCLTCHRVDSAAWYRRTVAA